MTIKNYQKIKIMTTSEKRYTVKESVKFGMLFGYKIYDNKEKEFTPYEFDEEEKYRADSRCELLNALKGYK
jgi:hypothetical protein